MLNGTINKRTISVCTHTHTHTHTHTGWERNKKAEAWKHWIGYHAFYKNFP